MCVSNMSYYRTEQHGWAKGGTRRGASRGSRLTDASCARYYKFGWLLVETWSNFDTLGLLAQRREGLVSKGLARRMVMPGRPPAGKNTMLSVRVFGTSIKVKASVLPLLLAVWGIVTGLGWRAHPDRTPGKAMCVGLLSAISLLAVEFGHAFAHIPSARLAKAPMDELLISAGMPRTLYWNNNVPPHAHRMRALGGPAYNAFGLLIGVVSYGFLRRNTLSRELVGWWTLGHGLQLAASLTPVPMVDGGSILKWTLVGKGRRPDEADQIVRRVDWGLGAAAALAGAAFIARRRWRPGLALIGARGIVTAIAARSLNGASR
jgi:hypothetical protein